MVYLVFVWLPMVWVVVASCDNCCVAVGNDDVTDALLGVDVRVFELVRFAVSLHDADTGCEADGEGRRDFVWFNELLCVASDEGEGDVDMDVLLVAVPVGESDKEFDAVDEKLRRSWCPRCRVHVFRSDGERVTEKSAKLVEALRVSEAAGPLFEPLSDNVRE